MGLLNFFSSLFGKAKQTSENTIEKKPEISEQKSEKAVEIIKNITENIDSKAAKPKAKKAPVKKHH